jgi:hypothetical protein
MPEIREISKNDAPIGKILGAGPITLEIEAKLKNEESINKIKRDINMPIINHGTISLVRFSIF